MSATRRDILLGIGLVAFLVSAVWAAVFVTSRTVNAMLHQDAAATGEAWARYLAANVEGSRRDRRRRPAVAPRAWPSSRRRRKSATSSSTRSSTPMAGSGLPPTSSRRPDMPPRRSPSTIRKPPRRCCEGETEVEVKEGTSPNRPAFYAEAYVPVVADGEITGIVEVYVDQSAKRDMFRAQVAGSAILLGGIIAAAFGLPAVGFYWRTRQKRAGRFARRVPRRSRPADRAPEPHALHAGPRPGRIARLPGRGPHRGRRPLQGGERHARERRRRRGAEAGREPPQEPQRRRGSSGAARRRRVRRWRRSCATPIRSSRSPAASPQHCASRSI